MISARSGGFSGYTLLLPWGRGKFIYALLRNGCGTDLNFIRNNWLSSSCLHMQEKTIHGTHAAVLAVDL